jgi:hypothetical protein
MCPKEFYGPTLPERVVERKETREERLEKVGRLEKVLKEIAKKLVEKKIPVSPDDCRIQMEKFQFQYGKEKITKDKEKVAKLLAPEELKEKEKLSDGRILEMIKTVIFNKILWDRFVVVRTSLYDDFFNHVDNLILGNKGEVVLAMDFAGKMDERKFEEVLERNKKGPKIDYGVIHTQEASGEIKNVLGPITNVPLVYVPLLPKFIEELLKQQELYDLGKISPREIDIYLYWMTLIGEQLQRLSKIPRQLPEEMTKRFPELRNILPEMIPKEFEPRLKKIKATFKIILKNG